MGRDEDDPCVEFSTPFSRSMGSKLFRNKQGYELRWDPAKPGKPEHWHVENPNKTGKSDKYLNMLGQPVAQGSDESHLYGDAIIVLMEILGGGTC